MRGMNEKDRGASPSVFGVGTMNVGGACVALGVGGDEKWERLCLWAGCG